MPNPFYAPGTSRAQRVNDLFDRIAARYDRLNDLQSLGLHKRWKTRLARLAHLEPHHRALDLCCGTGDIAFTLARTGAHVVGLDFSRAMLDVARARLQSISTPTAPHIEFIEANALEIPFPDNSFDAVTSAYGLRNLANLPRGLDEMARVAKPGGRILILEFGKPHNPLWRALFFGYLRHIVPLLGRVFCGDAAPYAYILESLNHYPDQAGVSRLLNHAGLAPVHIHNLLGGAMSIHAALKPPAH